MTEQAHMRNFTDTQWQAVRDRVSSTTDALEDGAYARAVADDVTGQLELHFYATMLNKPEGWRFPFAEEISQSDVPGAFVGRVWHDSATGFVHFEVVVYAAAQAVRADYESGVGDLDYVTYEQEVERAIAGNAEDLQWLRREFNRLANITL